MQVSVEATGSIERRMTVEIPQEQVSQEMSARLQRLARNAKVKGFRPGKVPMKVVAQQYGHQVRDEVMGELIQRSYFEAISQEKLNPAGMPRIEPEAMEEGKGLRYVAIFEVMPEPQLADVAGLQLEKYVAEITDADIDKMLENLRSQRTEWKPVKRKAKKGDRLNINFVGTIEGKEFSGNRGENVPVTIGSGRMIEGFEKGLAGAKAGEDLTLDLNFPEDYAHKEIAGKPVQFQVTVNSVEEPVMPEIDEEFVKQFGIADGTVEALRQEVRQNMERELKQALEGKHKQVVMDKLLEVNNIDVPKALVDNEAENLKQQMMQQMHIPKGKSGADLDASLFRGQAERRVTLGLILAELIKSKEIKASDEMVRSKVEEFAASYEDPQEVIDWYYADRQRLNQMEGLALEDAVVDWVYAQAEVSEKQSSFDELMGRG